MMTLLWKGSNKEPHLVVQVDSNMNKVSEETKEKMMEPKDVADMWSHRVDFNMAIYMLQIICFSIIHFILLSLDSDYPEFFNVHLSQFLQLFNCYMQLIIIVGLCLDNGHSKTSRFFKTETMQFLGTISFAIYLCHTPLLHYFDLFLNGPGFGRMNEFKDTCNHSYECMDVSWTVVLPFLVATLLTATFLNRNIEDKGRGLVTKLRNRYAP